MLSVIVICKNEAHNIARCLQSVAFADEIIVLDSGSTDNTVAIAKEYTPHVFSTDWQGYGVQKQRALEHASQKWVLNLDADEFVSPELQNDIKRVIQGNSEQGYRIPIQMHFYDKALKYSSSPSRHIRLFQREGARFSDDLVHEKIILPTDAKVSQLSTPILHHSFKDVRHVLYKINKYSSYSAKIRVDAGKKSSLLKAVLSSTWMFLRCYVLQRGFMDGKAGFIFAVFSAEGAFYRGIKQIYRDVDSPVSNAVQINEDLF